MMFQSAQPAHRTNAPISWFSRKNSGSTPPLKHPTCFRMLLSASSVFLAVIHGSRAAPVAAACRCGMLTKLPGAVVPDPLGCSWYESRSGVVLTHRYTIPCQWNHKLQRRYDRTQYRNDISFRSLRCPAVTTAVHTDRRHPVSTSGATQPSGALRHFFKPGPPLKI